MDGIIFDNIMNVLSVYMNKLVIAVVIMLLGIIIGRLLKKILEKILLEIELNRVFRKAANSSIDIEGAISSFAAYAVYFIALILALSQMGVASTAAYIISVAVILIVLASFFLGIKDFVPNFIAGIRLSRKGIKEGDNIKVDGVEGKIAHFDLIETRITTKKGDTIFMPNSVMLESKIVRLKR